MFFAGKLEDPLVHDRVAGLCAFFQTGSQPLELFLQPLEFQLAALLADIEMLFDQLEHSLLDFLSAFVRCTAMQVGQVERLPLEFVVLFDELVHFRVDLTHPLGMIAVTVRFTVAVSQAPRVSQIS